jgi:hypothetical protein
MVPWFERPVIFDVRARPSLIQSQSGSRDLQMVSGWQLRAVEGQLPCQVSMTSASHGSQF